MLVSCHITTHCHNPEDHDMNLHHENIKFCRQWKKFLHITLILMSGP